MWPHKGTTSSDEGTVDRRTLPCHHSCMIHFDMSPWHCLLVFCFMSRPPRSLALSQVLIFCKSQTALQSTPRQLGFNPARWPGQMARSPCVHPHFCSSKRSPNRNLVSSNIFKQPLHHVVSEQKWFFRVSPSILHSSQAARPSMSWQFLRS